MSDKQIKRDVTRMVAGPEGAAIYINGPRDEVVLADVAWVTDGGQQALKWVGIFPQGGEDVHWTYYDQLEAQPNIKHLMLGGEYVASIYTLDEATQMEPSELHRELLRFRELLTKYNNRETFKQFFDNE